MPTGTFLSEIGAVAVENIKTIAVIGLGYIGLPTAAILATQGIRVIGVDVKQDTVDAVNRGEVPFVEPDLGTYLAGAVTQGNLSASLETPQADAYIVAVPTPFKGDHEADLSYIDAAADGIAPQLRGGELIILESTSPPGATETMAARILDARPDLDQSTERDRLYFVHCPERVLPGRVMIELVTNDRIIGGTTTRAAERAKSLYETFCQGELLITDAKTAEMAKLVENSFRDVNIAFANELSIICDKLGIDVWELIELANHHPRVKILEPGPGVGGHCIAVDPWFIVSSVPDESRLIRTAREVNDAKPAHVIARVIEKAQRFKSPVVAAMGLAFKPDIDDLRESPAVKIVRELAAELPAATILAVEPHVDSLPPELSGVENVRLDDTVAAISKADIVLLLVDHSTFRTIKATELAERIVIDTKGLWR